MTKENEYSSVEKRIEKLNDDYRTALKKNKEFKYLKNIRKELKSLTEKLPFINRRKPTN